MSLTGGNRNSSSAQLGYLPIPYDFSTRQLHILALSNIIVPHSIFLIFGLPSLICRFSFSNRLRSY